MRKDLTAECAGVVPSVVLIVILMIFGGAISFGAGWLGGLFLKWICGTPVADGLNMLLGNITQHNFTPDDIPLFTAIMTTIGEFFKATHTTKSND